MKEQRDDKNKNAKYIDKIQNLLFHNLFANLTFSLAIGNQFYKKDHFALKKR